jgi:ABC-type multidrug transport system ATPase subunit
VRPLRNGAAVGRSGGGAAAHRTAYVQQDDVFYSQLTVGETLTMAAKMRMPAGTSRTDRDAAVAALLNRLGLAHVRETRVGDKKTRGISGGAAQVECS